MQIVTFANERRARETLNSSENENILQEKDKSESPDPSQSSLVPTREIDWGDDDSFSIQDEDGLTAADLLLSQPSPVEETIVKIKPKFPGPAGFLTPESKVFT